MKKELLKHKYFYWVLGALLIVAFILRIWRIDHTLGFYFDQGRDANVIWDLIHQGKFFLIGPTTGIAGIFRGPFYYYLITPFYWLGRGDPVYPAVLLAFLSTIAVLIMYIVANNISGKTTGLIAVILASFSFPIISASRWLSNPTPMLLLSMLLIWQMTEIATEKKRSRRTDLLWVGIAFTSGLSQFHFGSSGEFFYFLGLAVFTLWQRKKLPKIAGIITAILAFGVTAAPLIIFDLRHDRILSNNIGQFLGGGDTFKASFSEVFQRRVRLYYDVFSQKLFQWIRLKEQIALVVLSVSFVVLLPKLLKDNRIKVVLLMLLSPIVGFLFFQGNYGNIYDYYFTGYYLIFLLLVAIVLGQVWKNILGKIFVIVFLAMFLTWNWNVTKGYINAKPDNDQVIMFENQKQAIGWIYKDANGQQFNVDVYVPPVIPHAYDYLFRWQHNPHLVTEQVPLLYTLYEVDPPHPERLDAWLERQAGIGKVEYQQSFGGITVQRRVRL